MVKRPEMSAGFGADKTKPRKTPKEVAKVTLPDAKAVKLDGRTLRKTGRTEQFATRVTPEFKKRLFDLAKRDDLLIVEVLERALDMYDR